MGGILGYARVSTGDQDVAGPTMRREKAGAIKVFTDVMSGKSMDRPGLAGSVANMGHGRAASPSWGIRQHWRNAY